MHSPNINRVFLTAHLTRDPKLEVLPSGNSVCRMRVANSVYFRRAGGNIEQKCSYFDVVVLGSKAGVAARNLCKGRRVAIDGRLDWNEWQTPEGQKRQSVSIIAENFQFYSSDGPFKNETPTRSKARRAPSDSQLQLEYVEKLKSEDEQQESSSAVAADPVDTTELTSETDELDDEQPPREASRSAAKAGKRSKSNSESLAASSNGENEQRGEATETAIEDLFVGG